VVKELIEYAEVALWTLYFHIEEVALKAGKRVARRQCKYSPTL